MCVRGGFPRADRKKSDAPKLNWTRDVFTRLANHTDTHKATSVGHDLITHYQNYLAEYEDEHPEDVSVPDAGDDPCLLYTSPSPRDATLSRMPSSA